LRPSWAKAKVPATDRFTRYVDPTFGQNVFDIPITEAEAVIQPNGVADGILRKPTAMIERLSGVLPFCVANLQLIWQHPREDNLSEMIFEAEYLRPVCIQYLFIQYQGKGDELSYVSCESD
jgi:hypothetical protein